MTTVNITPQITLAISVKDREASAAWFEKHFGFKTLFSIEEAGWTELSTLTPNVTLGLGDADQPTAGNCVPVFGVNDIAATRAALEAQNVGFDGDTITIDGMVSLATFFDPDGNAFMLSQDLMDAPA